MSYRALRRDGSCFYRALMFRIFEKIIENDHPSTAANLVTKLQNGKQFMMLNGFEEIVVEDFCDIVLEALESCKEGSMTVEGL